MPSINGRRMKMVLSDVIKPNGITTSAERRGEKTREGEEKKERGRNNKGGRSKREESERESNR